MLRKAAVGFLACVVLDLAFSSYLCSQRAAYVQLPAVTHREKYEKYEIVKSAIELRKSEIEDGYTEEVSTCRQALLLDVRDKLLSEQEYARSTGPRFSPNPLFIYPGAGYLLPCVSCRRATHPG